MDTSTLTLLAMLIGALAKLADSEHGDVVAALALVAYVISKW